MRKALPDNWEDVELQSQFKLINISINPLSFPKETFLYFSIPNYDLTGTGQKALVKTINSSKYLLEEKCLLVSKLNPRKPRVLIAHQNDNFRAISSTELLPLVKTSSKISYLFVKYLLLSHKYTGKLDSLAIGSTNSHTRYKPRDLLRVNIPLPPLSEQQNIAEILSTVDKSIEKTDAIIKETRQLKKGLIQKLFTEGIGHTRFKETKIGSIPEAWEINRLNNFGEFLRGKSINKSEITESGFPCVRYGDIYVQYEFANTVTHFSAFIGKETADNGQRIKYGDIIFAGTGETQEDIGKCVAYVRDEKAYAGGDLFLFRPSNGISVNSEFLSYCLNSGEVGRLKSRLGQGLSIFHIYPIHVQVLEVPLPTIKEQNQIVKILSDVDAKIEKEEATKTELEQLKKGLMQVLLTGKVRVKS